MYCNHEFLIWWDWRWRKMDRVFQFPFVGGKRCIKADEIVYIETARHKNIFYVGNQTYSLYKKLDEIEEELKGTDFIRVHQSFLVNMRYIEKISGYVLYLNNGKELSVPKARYPTVKRQYIEFKGKQMQSENRTLGPFGER